MYNSHASWATRSHLGPWMPLLLLQPLQQCVACHVLARPQPPEHGPYTYVSCNTVHVFCAHLLPCLPLPLAHLLQQCVGCQVFANPQPPAQRPTGG
mmetsp:Transcript_93692/g.242071  ORF Transcript_93692/g.242071 Transcript_93692/m.242071 type:complete len:96 (-) Transcript_93692:112-399(-)